MAYIVHYKTKKKYITLRILTHLRLHFYSKELYTFELLHHMIQLLSNLLGDMRLMCFY